MRILGRKFVVVIVVVVVVISWTEHDEFFRYRRNTASISEAYAQVRKHYSTELLCTCNTSKLEIDRGEI